MWPQNDWFSCETSIMTNIQEQKVKNVAISVFTKFFYHLTCWSTSFCPHMTDIWHLCYQNTNWYNQSRPQRGWVQDHIHRSLVWILSGAKFPNHLHIPPWRCRNTGKEPKKLSSNVMNKAVRTCNQNQCKLNKQLNSS